MHRSRLYETGLDCRRFPYCHRFPDERSDSGQKVGLALYLKAAQAGIRANLVAAAQEMPENDYAFKPTTMPEVRTYGQLFTHVATGQFSACAAMKGVQDPMKGRDLEHEFVTKAAVVQVLSDSFAFCADAVASLTDENAMELVRQGQGEVARSAVLVGLIAHNAEMYGISTVYLRGRNLVPPSTEQVQRGSGPRGSAGGR